jgi:hypothetical protein
MSKLLPKALVIVAALAWFIAPVQALEPKWPPGPYKYLVIDQDIQRRADRIRSPHRCTR